MTIIPLPDRRQHPRVPGMTVIQPGDIDDDLLGACAKADFCCDNCDGCEENRATPPTYADAVIRRAYATDAPAIPTEAGNIWFAGPEPEPSAPMATIDAIALGALLLMSAVTVVGVLAWLWGSLQALQLGA